MNGEKVTCRLLHNGVLLCAPQFDVAQIAKSGQCFRIAQLDGGGFLAVTGQHFVKITVVETGGYVFHCSWGDFRDVWVPYFDLSADYEMYQSRMTGDQGGWRHSDVAARLVGDGRHFCNLPA